MTIPITISTTYVIVHRRLADHAPALKKTHIEICEGDEWRYVRDLIVEAEYCWEKGTAYLCGIMSVTKVRSVRYVGFSPVVREERTLLWGRNLIRVKYSKNSRGRDKVLTSIRLSIKDDWLSGMPSFFAPENQNTTMAEHDNWLAMVGENMDLEDEDGNIIAT